MKISKHYYGGAPVADLFETVELTEEILEKIADWNGSPVEKVREWLEEGLQVHTNFGFYQKASEQ